MPGRKNRQGVVLDDQTIYTLRKRRAMFFGRLKEHRRLTVRYEKMDATFLGCIAMAILAAFYL